MLGSSVGDDRIRSHGGGDAARQSESRYVSTGEPGVGEWNGVDTPGSSELHDSGERSERSNTATSGSTSCGIRPTGKKLRNKGKSGSDRQMQLESGSDRVYTTVLPATVTCICPRRSSETAMVSV